MWWLYVLLVVLFIVGVLLLPPKPREIAFRILFFPIGWLLCILTFPFHYFKNLFYTKKATPIAVKKFSINKSDDFKIVVVHKDGREDVIKPFDTEENNNAENSINKK